MVAISNVSSLEWTDLPWRSLVIYFEHLLCHLPSVIVLENIRECESIQEPPYTVCGAGKEGSFLSFYFLNPLPKLGSQFALVVWASTLTTRVVTQRYPALPIDQAISVVTPSNLTSLEKFVWILIQLNVKTKKELRRRESEKRASCHQGLSGSGLSETLESCILPVSEYSGKGTAIP